MYAILLAVFSSFAIGLIAGVAAAWVVQAHKKHAPGPTGGTPLAATGDPTSEQDSPSNVIDLNATRRHAA